MLNRKAKWITIFATAVIFFNVTVPVFAGGRKPSSIDVEIANELNALRPLSIEMVDKAIAVLSRGWIGMDTAEQEAFLRLYDPSGSGDVDELFVTTVRDNYIRIRHALNDEIPVQYEPQSRICDGMRLYYTDLLMLHVCPYFLTETNELRKARTLIHEYTHIALRVTDGPYFRPTSKSYAQLTPRGSAPSWLPLIGPLIRAIAADDTLHHPDAYAHFAVAVCGHPGALEMYRDQSVDFTAAHYLENLRELVRSNPVADSWARQRG